MSTNSTIQFWSNDPTIIFNKEYIFELWPTSEMTYDQKLNAITRLIILITVLGYIATQKNRILIVGSITLFVIYALFMLKKQKNTENFTSNKNEEKQKQNNQMSENKTDEIAKHIFKSEFKEGTKKNPFSNVLLTQIGDDPERKSAPPAFNPEVDVDITKKVKRVIQNLNPGIKNTNKQLFGDLYENFNLDQSNRAFFSTANTRIENDQKAFGEYLYGNMQSSKESTAEGAVMREKDAFRYNLY